MITADYDAPGTHTVHFHTTTDWPYHLGHSYVNSDISLQDPEYMISQIFSYMSCEDC